jgi:hypothetical protein
MEGETPPNSNVLFLVVFENEVSTPLFLCLHIGAGDGGSLLL